MKYLSGSLRSQRLRKRAFFLKPSLILFYFLFIRMCNLVMKGWLSNSFADARFSGSKVRALVRNALKLKSFNFQHSSTPSQFNWKWEPLRNCVPTFELWPSFWGNQEHRSHWGFFHVRRMTLDSRKPWNDGDMMNVINQWKLWAFATEKWDRFFSSDFLVFFMSYYLLHFHC